MGTETRRVNLIEKMKWESGELAVKLPRMRYAPKIECRALLAPEQAREAQHPR